MNGISRYRLISNSIWIDPSVSKFVSSLFNGRWFSPAYPVSFTIPELTDLIGIKKQGAQYTLHTSITFYCLFELLKYIFSNSSEETNRCSGVKLGESVKYFNTVYNVDNNSYTSNILWNVDKLKLFAFKLCNLISGESFIL